MKRTVLLTLLALGLTGCISAYGTASRPTPVPFITPPTVMPSPDTTTATTPPVPTAIPSSPSTPAATAPPPAAAAPAAPAMLSRSFAVIAVGGSFVSGAVQVTDRNGSFVASVSVRGLPGGSSLHTVHIHLGSCANPYGGMHLTVLGLLASNGAGTGSLTASLPPVYVSGGHYVIVYSNASPQIIVGCANLSALG